MGWCRATFPRVEVLVSGPTYPEGPEAKDNDDKVHGVGQEHEHVHVGHSAVVGVDEVVEELPDGHVDLQSPGRQENHARASRGQVGGVTALSSSLLCVPLPAQLCYIGWGCYMA